MLGFHEDAQSGFARVPDALSRVSAWEETRVLAFVFYFKLKLGKAFLAACSNCLCILYNFCFVFHNQPHFKNHITRRNSKLFQSCQMGEISPFSSPSSPELQYLQIITLGDRCQNMFERVK